MKVKNHKLLNSILKRKANQAGFTLIEVLVSMTILAMGILGLITIVNLIMYHQSKSREVTQATLLIKNKIEEIKRISINEPSGGIFGFNYLVTDYLVAESMNQVNNKKYSRSEVLDKGKELPQMTRTLTLQTYPQDSNRSFSDPDQINLLEVIVRMEWVDKRGDTKSMEMGSLIHKRHFIE
mgnify:FL=1|jgi:prepilin-type N-terminal cleavage/methylation domain-containing protein